MTDALTTISPVWVPRLLLRTIAAPLGGVSSALITNPLDVIRARIQVCITPGHDLCFIQVCLEPGCDLCLYPGVY